MALVRAVHSGKSRSKEEIGQIVFTELGRRARLLGCGYEAFFCIFHGGDVGLPIESILALDYALS